MPRKMQWKYLLCGFSSGQRAPRVSEREGWLFLKALVKQDTHTGLEQLTTWVPPASLPLGLGSYGEPAATLESQVRPALPTSKGLVQAEAFYFCDYPFI